MCAIVDADVVHQVFGSGRPEAGAKFFQWLNTGSGRLVAGGKLTKELAQASPGFRQWARRAVAAGRMKIERDSQVDARAQELWRERKCKSNDPHAIALAQISGARLLYSNDRKLQEDFRSKNLIDSPRGKVYTTLTNTDFVSSHRSCLRGKTCVI